MRYQYYYCAKYKPELMEFLDTNRIRYQVSEIWQDKPPLVVFTILSDRPNAQSYVAALEEMREKPRRFIEYSESERTNARLLWLMPRSQKIDVINTDSAFEYSCRLGRDKFKHERQKGLIAIAKEPPEKARNAFWTSSSGFAELYTDRRVYEAVQAADLSGVEFLNVIRKDGKFSKRLFQMVSHSIIPQACMERGHGEIVETCPLCGQEQYSIDSAYQLHLDLSKFNLHSDFYMTERVFGPGIAEPLYIISQRFYRLLKENRLTCGADFYPVHEADMTR